MDLLDAAPVLGLAEAETLPSASRVTGEPSLSPTRLPGIRTSSSRMTTIFLELWLLQTNFFTLMMEFWDSWSSWMRLLRSQASKVKLLEYCPSLTRRRYLKSYDVIVMTN